MLSQKLADLIQSMSKVELNQLEKFVVSPFYNQHVKVIELFSYIKGFYPDFNHPQLEKKKISEVLYPNETYNDARIRNVISDLTKLVEQFLIWKQLEDRPLDKAKYLLEATKERNIDKYHKPILNQLSRIQEETDYRDVFFYFNQHQLLEEQYEYTAKKSNRAVEHSLQQLTDNLDIYYLSKKLKYCCEMVNRMNVFAEEYNLGLFEEIEEYLKKRKFYDVPVINIYYQILLTLTESDNEKHYFALKELLKKYSKTFTKDDNQVNYSFAQNYCIKKINSGQSNYLNELFDLYKLSLKNEVLFDGARLSQWDYKNITTVGLRLDEKDWVKEFIYNYKSKIHQRFRENAFKYNLANYYFYEGDFGEAMQLLLQVEFTDIFYNLDSKSLLLKSYYELEEYEALFAHSEAFKNYLRRNDKISNYQKLVYKNLVKYLTRLARIKVSNRSIPKKLANEINETSQIADVTWLRKIINREL